VNFGQKPVLMYDGGLGLENCTLTNSRAEDGYGQELGLGREMRLPLRLPHRHDHPPHPVSGGLAAGNAHSITVAARIDI
jgi:hypothetical protein